MELKCARTDKHKRDSALFESHQSGIEILSSAIAVGVDNEFESHQSGIEIEITRWQKIILSGFESHQSGIEIRQTGKQISSIESLNRTRVELKSRCDERHDLG